MEKASNRSHCLETLLFYLSQDGTEKQLEKASNRSHCLETITALPQPEWNGEAPDDGE